MPRSKKKPAQNADFRNLARHFFHDASRIDQTRFRNMVIQKWNIPQQQQASSLLQLTREFILEAAWQDFQLLMQKISVEINDATQSSEPYYHNQSYSLDDDFNFHFTNRLVNFEVDNENYNQALIDLPVLQYELLADNEPLHKKFSLPNTNLMMAIANTHSTRAVELIRAGADVNKYSVEYGNTPLMLSLGKGWNHIANEADDDVLVKTENQKMVIEELLSHPECDINAIEAVHGLSAAHIICIRGDDPALFELMIQRKADFTAVDARGKTPKDYLAMTYTQAQQEVSRLTGEFEFGSYDNPPHMSFTTTLPTQEERARNIILINKIFARMEHEAPPPQKRLKL